MTESFDKRFVDGARAGSVSGAGERLAALAGVRERPAVLSARQLVDRVFALSPSAYLRRVPGRETFAWPEGDLVVKRFQRADRRDAWYERLRGGPVRSPGRRECENLEALAADGFPVPAGLAWAEDRDGRSFVVMELVPHRETVRARLAASPAHRGAHSGDASGEMESLADLVARLHEAGWYHRDLYLQHLVVAGAGEPVLLDVGRARRERAPRRRWFVKDLAALLHSAPAAVGRAARLRFLARYLERRGLSDRRRWAGDVLAKERRMAAHRPRHVDPRTAHRAREESGGSAA